MLYPEWCCDSTQVFVECSKEENVIAAILDVKIKMIRANSGGFHKDDIEFLAAFPGELTPELTANDF